MKKTMLLTTVLLFSAAVAWADMGGMTQGAMGGMDLVVASDGTVLTARRVATNDPNTPMSSELVAISSIGSVLWNHAVTDGIHGVELAGTMVLVSGGAGMNGQDSDGGMRDWTGKSHLTALSLSSGAELWTLEFDGALMSMESASTQIYALVRRHDLEAEGATTSQASAASRRRPVGMPGMGSPTNPGGGMQPPTTPGTGTQPPMDPGMGNPTPGQPGSGWAMDGDVDLVAISNNGTVLWTLPLHP